MAEETQVQSEAGRAWRLIALIWGWVFVLFGLLAALFAATSGKSLGLGFALLLAGLLVLPIGTKAMRQVLPFTKPRLGLSLTIIAAFVAVLVGGNQMHASRVQAERAESRTSGKLEREVQAMWSELEANTKPCDQAAAAASANLDPARFDRVTAYQAAQHAQKVCGDAGFDTLAISAPRSLDAPKRKAFKVALQDCGMAYGGKSAVFKEMLKVIDGDSRPSQLAHVQAVSGASQQAATACVLTLMSMAADEGVNLSPADTSIPSTKQ